MAQFRVSGIQNPVRNNVNIDLCFILFYEMEQILLPSPSWVFLYPAVSSLKLFTVFILYGLGSNFRKSIALSMLAAFCSFLQLHTLLHPGTSSIYIDIFTPEPPINRTKSRCNLRQEA